MRSKLLQVFNIFYKYMYVNFLHFCEKIRIKVEMQNFFNKDDNFSTPKNVYIKKSSLAKPAKMMSFRLRQNLAEIRVNKMRTFDLNAFLLLRIGPLHRPTKCFELLFPYPIVLVIE